MGKTSIPTKRGFIRTYIGMLMAFKHSMRLGNCLMGILIVTVSSFVVLKFDFADHLETIVPASLVAFFLMAGGNMMNDVFDAEIDRAAHPSRAIPTGRFSKRFVLLWAVSFHCLAVLFAAFINIYCLVFAVGGIALLALYELWLKKYPGIGNLVIGALVGCIFLGTAAALGRWKVISFLALLGTLINVAREMIKDVEDMEGDIDRLTFPRKYGVEPTLHIAWGILAVNMIISFLPYYPLGLFSGYIFLVLIIITDLTVLYSIVLSRKNAERAQQLLKLAMLVALVGFLLGDWL